MPGGNLRESARTLSILNKALTKYGPRDFEIKLWDGTTVPADSGQETRFVLSLNSPGALRRMLFPPNELALGESYLDGDWDLDGDIMAAMKLGDVFEELALGLGDILGLARQLVSLPRETEDDHVVSIQGRHRAQLDGNEHSKERDRKAISYHYDVGNDFFELFLDRRMVYSCAYFPNGEEDLDSAQEAKLEHTCRKLRLKPGERFLDIGCGWGSLIMHAASRFGVEAVGITLSQRQAELATRRIAEAGLQDRCKVLLLDYRDVPGFDVFDKIASVGMVEHVGRARLPEYFQAAWDSLKPGGLFLNHGITAASGPKAAGNLLDRFVFQRGAFIRKYVFPDGELIPVGEMLGFAEKVGFEVRDVESLREHYARTLEHWVHRLDANRDEALSQTDERTYRVWRLYMAGCSHAFTTSRLSIHQSLLSKPDEAGSSRLPWNRSYIYERPVL
ncbi:MAG TPA: cyclopropane-fatty-acyl-phospholipid synthase family protein [Chloroflexota bacterium]